MNESRFLPLLSIRALLALELAERLHPGARTALAEWDGQHLRLLASTDADGDERTLLEPVLIEPDPARTRLRHGERIAIHRADAPGLWRIHRPAVPGFPAARERPQEPARA